MHQHDDTPVRKAVGDIRSRGFAVCRVDPGEKKPTYKGWTTRSLEPDEFTEADLVGIMGGPLSNGGKAGHAGAIIDLDSPEVVETADEYLPPTKMAEGRPSKPRSHRYYLIPLDSIPEWAKSEADQASKAALDIARHPGPFTKSFRHRETEKEVIKFIGTGGQAVCPPSLHPSGERREWDGGTPGDPAVVPFIELWDCACRLASACGAKMPNVTLPHHETAASHKTWTRRTSAGDERRASKYLQTIEGAVSGQGGHNQTFKAARCLVWGFCLSKKAALRLLIDEYNPRCNPPWTEKELLHKVEDADVVPFGKPRGYLRDTPRSQTPNKASSGNTEEHREECKPGFLTNFTTIKDVDDDGDKVESRVGLSGPAIHRMLSRQSGDWPRRVGQSLFVRDGDNGPLWLTHVHDLFGWAQTLYGDGENSVLWGDRSVGLLSRTEFHAYLRQTVTNYRSVESAPHEPLIPDHYYIYPALAGGDGKALSYLLNRFSPYTESDFLLLKAFLLSLFWGGPYGQRPAFLFTGPDNDKEMGRGVGKTTFVRMASKLTGGLFEVRPTDPWDDIIRRLLSNTECSTQRLILVDNVKTHRFSWADIEALITSEYVNGRKMYVGDGRRPNTFTVAITLNGANLSKDLAQRCVIVKLNRPQHSGEWESEVSAFIDANRWAIVGDIIAELKKPQKVLSEFSRWGLWEKEVLGRLPDADQLRKLIDVRRSEVDDDQQESDIIRHAIIEEMESRGHGDANDIGVKIPVATMAKIVNDALNERFSTTAVTTKLKAIGGGIPELGYTTSGTQRVWAWKGKNFPANGRMEFLRESQFSGYR